MDVPDSLIHDTEVATNLNIQSSAAILKGKRLATEPVNFLPLIPSSMMNKGVVIGRRDEKYRNQPLLCFSLFVKNN